MSDEKECEQDKKVALPNPFHPSFFRFVFFPEPFPALARLYEFQADAALARLAPDGLDYGRSLEIV
jgi:hypothetical protein